MINSKKGFELSVNMIVVLILGLVILGVGVSIFFSAYGEVNELRSNVDAQTESRINSLLDDGSLIVIPFTNKDCKRGDFVDFDLGINNELGNSFEFSVLVTYAGSPAYLSNDPFYPIDVAIVKSLKPRDLCPDINNPDGAVCGTGWVLMVDTTYSIKNNERAMVPLRIVIPKKDVLKGQYIFNVDICYNASGYDANCELETGVIANRYSSRQKLYISI